MSEIKANATDYRNMQILCDSIANRRSFNTKNLMATRDFQFSGQCGRLALSAACNLGPKCKDRDRMIALLIEKGCDVNEKDEDGLNLLCWCCARNEVKLAKFLIARNPMDLDYNLTDGEGNTPLMLAVGTGNIELVSLILDSYLRFGIDVDQRNYNDMTAYTLALSLGYSEIADMLIRYGHASRHVLVSPTHASRTASDKSPRPDKNLRMVPTPAQTYYQDLAKERCSLAHITSEKNLDSNTNATTRYILDTSRHIKSHQNCLKRNALVSPCIDSVTSLQKQCDGKPGYQASYSRVTAHRNKECSDTRRSQIREHVIAKANKEIYLVIRPATGSSVTCNGSRTGSENSFTSNSILTDTSFDLLQNGDPETFKRKSVDANISAARRHEKAVASAQTSPFDLGRLDTELRGLFATKSEQMTTSWRPSTRHRKSACVDSFGAVPINRNVRSLVSPDLLKPQRPQLKKRLTDIGIVRLPTRY